MSDINERDLRNATDGNSPKDIHTAIGIFQENYQNVILGPQNRQCSIYFPDRFEKQVYGTPIEGTFDMNFLAGIDTKNKPRLVLVGLASKNDKAMGLFIHPVNFGTLGSELDIVKAYLMMQILAEVPKITTDVIYETNLYLTSRGAGISLYPSDSIPVSNDFLDSLLSEPIPPAVLQTLIKTGTDGYPVLRSTLYHLWDLHPDYYQQWQEQLRAVGVLSPQEHDLEIEKFLTPFTPIVDAYMQEYIDPSKHEEFKLVFYHQEEQMYRWKIPEKNSRYDARTIAIHGITWASRLINGPEPNGVLVKEKSWWALTARWAVDYFKNHPDVLPAKLRNANFYADSCVEIQVLYDEKFAEEELDFPINL